MTSADVIVLYQELVADFAARSKHYEGGNILQALRTEVHARLQAENKPPQAEPNEDPEDTHARQKKHFRDLWKQADVLIKQAQGTQS